MSQSEEETALIRGIVANPDDDSQRLVYADWLEEHGREARARLIRVQCQVERLKAEERELIERHGREWGKTLLAAGADHWTFHRGFPEEVTMRFGDYLSEHARLNDVTPLSHLHLIGGTDEDLRRLASLPAAHQIRSLEIDQRSNRPEVVSYGVEGVRSLATSPHLSGLRQLSLHSHRVGVDGADVIAKSPTFANLTHLAITDPALQHAGNEPLLQIVRAPHLSGLVELHVGDATFGSHILRSMRSGWPGQAGGRGTAI